MFKKKKVKGSWFEGTRWNFMLQFVSLDSILYASLELTFFSIEFLYR